MGFVGVRAVSGEDEGLVSVEGVSERSLLPGI